MKKKKIIIKDKEKIILLQLDLEGGTATPHEISTKTGISYITVKKYLNKLVEEGILIVENGRSEEGSKSKKGKD